MRRLGMLLAAPCAMSVLLVGALVFVMPARAGSLPATGQTTAYPADKHDGIVGAVAVPDDGTLQRGASLRYTVLKNGTVKDQNTGLIWEMKCWGCGGLHDVTIGPPWSGDGSMDTIWDWLAQVNAEGGTGYAKHKDWRIPNVKELLSIVDYSVVNPATAPLFSSATGLFYWSSTTYAGNPSTAWAVGFNVGGLGVFDKSFSFLVRAVRGGPK